MARWMEGSGVTVVWFAGSEMSEGSAPNAVGVEGRAHSA